MKVTWRRYVAEQPISRERLRTYNTHNLKGASKVGHRDNPS